MYVYEKREMKLVEKINLSQYTITKKNKLRKKLYDCFVFKFELF